MLAPARQADGEIPCDREGDLVTGILWYHCNANKTIDILGCQTPDNQTVKLNETVNSGDFVLKCYQLEDKYISLSPVGCNLDGTVLNSGEKTAKGNFYYQCRKTAKSYLLEVVGCASEDGQLVDYGGYYHRDNFKYKCIAKDDHAVEAPSACLNNGEEIRIGKTFTENGFYYRCDKTEGSTEIKVVAEGCVDSSNKRRKMGETYKDQHFVYNCSQETTNQGTRMRVDIASCVATDVDGINKERNFGEEWYQFHPENSKFKYRLRCSGDKEYAFYEIVKCVVKRQGADIEIDVGCGTQYGKKAVFICQKNEEGDVDIEVQSVPNGQTFADLYAKYKVKQC